MDNKFKCILKSIALLGMVGLLSTCGGGDGGGSGVTVFPRFAYAVGTNNNSLNAYAVDNQTGRWHLIGSAATNGSPAALTVDPAGKFAYVANSTPNSISQYLVNTDGRLNPNGTIAAGITPESITVGPTGQFVYAVNSNFGGLGGGGSVSQYSINAGGTLAPNGTVGAGIGARSIAVLGGYE